MRRPCSTRAGPAEPRRCRAPDLGTTPAPFGEDLAKAPRRDWGTGSAAVYNYAQALKDNDVDPIALVLSTNIFPAVAAEIADAQSEVDFQTFHWDPASDAAKDTAAFAIDSAGIGRIS